MFTGIVTYIGKIVKLEFNDKKDYLLGVEIKNVARKTKIGCSIACNGICLTLIEQEKGVFYFKASTETHNKTTLKSWFLGQEINIEFALRAGDEFGGHITSGHIDGCAILKSKSTIKDSVKMIFELTNKNSDLARFIVKKGSICIDGVSLTVNESMGNEFAINIIEHTLNNTILRFAKIGDKVNIEIDLIARYLLAKK